MTPDQARKLLADAEPICSELEVQAAVGRVAAAVSTVLAQDNPLVLAIMGKDRPGFHVHLVESMTKRCRFLTQVVEALDLPATVHNTRAENLTLAVDIVTARACAPLHRLFGYARSYLAMGAQGLFLKGQDVEAELTEATKYWNIEPLLHPSRTGGHGWIVELNTIERR